MPYIEKMTIQQMLNDEGLLCECDREHRTNLRYLRIERGAVDRIPEMIRVLGCSRPMVVSDLNTEAAAGQRVKQILLRSGIPFSEYCFATAERLAPAEWELGSLTMRFDPKCDLILAVGGGVLNDLCKMLARATGKPSAFVATAPSMDGFVSNSGAMEVNHIKTTIYTPAPAAVICDTEILAQAPERMLYAGIGDMVAKYISVCEWRISHIINGEYFCDSVANMMREAVRKVMAAPEAVLRRDCEAVGVVTEGLVLAGMAMTFAQVSRPASGLEHCFSHIWEMMALERGRGYDLHGIQVGVGTVIALKLYEWLRTIHPTVERMEASIAAFDESAWEENLRRVFGSDAEHFIHEEKTSLKNEPQRRRERGRHIINRWDEILRVIDEEIPNPKDVIQRLESIGLPTTVGSIGVSKRDMLDAFYCSRDIRDRYLSTSMLFDIGMLDDARAYLDNIL